MEISYPPPGMGIPIKLDSTFSNTSFSTVLFWRNIWQTAIPFFGNGTLRIINPRKYELYVRAPIAEFTSKIVSENNL